MVGEHLCELVSPNKYVGRVLVAKQKGGWGLAIRQVFRLAEERG